MGLQVSCCVYAPNDGGKQSSGKPAVNWDRFSNGLARQRECQILEGHLMPDNLHMCIAIPPKHPVASVIGFLKGKSAIATARLYCKERNFSGEHFWARGYAVSTVGFELEQVRQYRARDRGWQQGDNFKRLKGRFSATPSLV
jgi:REP element-mobilizing transposase RayT